LIVRTKRDGQRTRTFENREQQSQSGHGHLIRSQPEHGVLLVVISWRILQLIVVDNLEIREADPTAFRRRHRSRFARRAGRRGFVRIESMCNKRNHLRRLVQDLGSQLVHHLEHELQSNDGPGEQEIGQPACRLVSQVSAKITYFFAVSNPSTPLSI
jgi:hypothetical protein